MNGTLFDEIKKKDDHKKKEKIKFFISLLLTNFLTACLMTSLRAPPNIETQRKEIVLKNHPRYKMISIPLQVLTELNPSQDENAVTIIDKSKKIIFQKAYLHETIVDSNKELSSPTRFKIEIPEDEILKLNADSSDLLIAIPEIKENLLQKKRITKRVSSYEINL